MRRLILFSDKKQTLFIGKTPHKADPGGVRLEPAGISGAVEDLPPELGQLHPAAVGDTNGADPAKQLFSFKLSDDRLNRLSCAAEQYLLTQTGRRFGTLDYWKKVKYDRKKPPPQGEVLSEAKRKGARSAVRWYPLQTRHRRASSPKGGAIPLSRLRRQLPQRGSHPLRQTMNKSPAVTPKKFAP